jgi:hypothetical protein
MIVAGSAGDGSEGLEKSRRQFDPDPDGEARDGTRARDAIREFDRVLFGRQDGVGMMAGAGRGDPGEGPGRIIIMIGKGEPGRDLEAEPVQEAEESLRPGDAADGHGLFPAQGFQGGQTSGMDVDGSLGPDSIGENEGP